MADITQWLDAVSAGDRQATAKILPLVYDIAEMLNIGKQIMAVLKRVCEDRPRPIREIIPKIPSRMAQIVERLHQKDPADRFQSAKEVAETLAGCEAELKKSRQP